jgi:hypothetical protein
MRTAKAKYEKSTSKKVRGNAEQVRAEAKSDGQKVRATQDATSDPYIYKEINNINGKVVGSNSATATNTEESNHSRADRSASKTHSGRTPTKDATLPIKDKDSMTADSAPKTPSVKTAKPKKSKKKSTTTRPKIDLNNPCASCPARDTKGDRFVDGEGI